MIRRTGPSSALLGQRVVTGQCHRVMVRCGCAPQQLAHTRKRLEAFAAEIFTPLARRDQRAKGLTYLRGLLLDGRRKSLKTGLGLDHFEGRSWAGWHRHVTLVTAAHLFCTELRLSCPKAAGAA
jgi:hypothetical protein